MNQRADREIYLRAIKWIAWGLLTCLVAAVAIGWGLGWYYGNKLVPTGLQTENSVTSSKAYQQAADQMIAAAEKRRAAARTDDERWPALKELAFFLVDKGKLKEARTCAEELIALAPKYKDNKDYGDALHIAHITLGRIALHGNDSLEAGKQLLAAARVPVSPRLASLGPNMILAQELLEKGVVPVVEEYLTLCGAFWKSDKLAQWRQSMEKNVIPDFGSNLLKL